MDVEVMLCDYAEVSGGKLFISGAGINLLGTPMTSAPHVVNIALAMLVKIPWTATNQAHELTVELISDGGGDTGQERVHLSNSLPPGRDQADMGLIVAQFNAGRAPTMQPGEESLLPVAMPMMSLPLPRPGNYFFSVKIDGDEQDRVSFRVQVPNPVMGGAMGSPTAW